MTALRVGRQPDLKVILLPVMLSRADEGNYIYRLLCLALFLSCFIEIKLFESCFLQVQSAF